MAVDRTEKALSNFLRPEFINRVDEIVVFRSLDERDFVSIASIMLDDLKKALLDKDIMFNYTEQAACYIAEEYSLAIQYYFFLFSIFKRAVNNTLIGRMLYRLTYSIRSVLD